jgi:hypothetical protein
VSGIVSIRASLRRLILLALCLILLVMVASCGCAYVGYDPATNKFRAWTFLKDYQLGGVSISTNGLSIGTLRGDTDDKAVGTAVETGVHAVKGF